MAEGDTIEEGVLEQLVQKLTPCIERGNLDACVEEAARLADEIGISADEVLRLAGQMGEEGKYELAYVLALGGADGLDGFKKAQAYSNAGLAVQFLGYVDKAEIHHLKAIDVDQNYAVAHYNYSLLLEELNRKDEAETHYLKAIEADPNYAAGYNNYALLLAELGRKDEAEFYYLKAIESDSSYTIAYNNYAILLEDLNRKDEAETHYLKAIESDPSYAPGLNNYAILLAKLNKKTEAKIHYLKAIESDPKLAEAHGAYSIFLIDYGRRDNALSETELASELFKEIGRITQSYLTKAWFYQKYSEKYFNQKQYLKSSSDLDKASDEYFKAAETTGSDLIDHLKLQGNLLKAKSFMRNIPPKPWYNKIHSKLGKKPNIPELVYNLQNAAIWYQKASLCPVDGKKDICTACYLSINTFSEVLSAINAFINGNNAEIDKTKWLISLGGARKTYADNELEAGLALVDSLKQLVKCADKLAEQKVIGLKIQEERLGKCYKNLIKVNENLGGVLGIISDHTTEFISDYAKKEGMRFVGEGNQNKSFFDNPLVKAAIWVIGAFVAIILSIIANQLFEWRIQDIVFAGIYNM